jgi:hypothetical protein
MRFLVDENLGRRLVHALRDRGHQYGDQLVGQFSVITDQSICIRPLPDTGTTP